MNGNYLFDTSTVIYYLQGCASWVDFIDNTPMTIRLTSVITKMELLSYHGLEPDEQDSIQRFLSELTVVPLDSAIENTTITLRRATRLKLPDAIIAATAITTNATLVTGDQRMAELSWPNLKIINPK